MPVIALSAIFALVIEFRPMFPSAAPSARCFACTVPSPTLDSTVIYFQVALSAVPVAVHWYTVPVLRFRYRSPMNAELIPEAG